jgi:polyferredoxin
VHKQELHSPAEHDLLRRPVFAWLRNRKVVQAPLLVIALLMLLHGFSGPALAPKNLATTVSWVHYRGALMLVLLAAGNLFCLGCPFVFARDLARRFHAPTRNWPRFLRNKGLSVALLVLVLFSYELLDLWGSPLYTAVLLAGYFAACIAVDVLFKHGSFCKYVCPIGQFSFMASTLSPLEVRVRKLDVCGSCTTHDCIRGQRSTSEPVRIVKRGCELALYQPQKRGNLDCTFCMDCVNACPHDNVGLFARLPAAELWETGARSGLGRIEKRTDLSVLAIVFTFAALLNAFGMVSPVYAFEAWLSARLGATHEAPVLAAVFALGLCVEPLVLLGGAAWATRKLAQTKAPLLSVTTRFSYALVPMGAAVWLAHYGFHFFTGLFTLGPVVHGMLRDLGFPLSEVHYGAAGLPAGLVYPLELGFLGLGLVVSVSVAYRIAQGFAPERAVRGALPFASLALLLCAASLWLLSQPMEMRGTFLGG